LRGKVDVRAISAFQRVFDALWQGRRVTGRRDCPRWRGPSPAPRKLISGSADETGNFTVDHLANGTDVYTLYIYAVTSARTFAVEVSIITSGGQVR
jgi:hypothetical protein